MSSAVSHALHGTNKRGGLGDPFCAGTGNHMAFEVQSMVERLLSDSHNHTSLALNHFSPIVIPLFLCQGRQGFLRLVLCPTQALPNERCVTDSGGDAEFNKESYRKRLVGHRWGIKDSSLCIRQKDLRNVCENHVTWNASLAQLVRVSHLKMLTSISTSISYLTNDPPVFPLVLLIMFTRGHSFLFFESLFFASIRFAHNGIHMDSEALAGRTWVRRLASPTRTPRLRQTAQQPLLSNHVAGEVRHAFGFARICA